VPKFGFQSTFGWNNEYLGEHVTHVQFGGPAGRLGLEPGDAIVGVNGRDLQTANCWYNAIERAADNDGWVTLKIVDGRSGRMAYRTANLFQLNAR
jgi:S1-C subfamily serine protease